MSSRAALSREWLIVFVISRCCLWSSESFRRFDTSDIDFLLSADFHTVTALRYRDATRMPSIIYSFAQGSIRMRIAWANPLPGRDALEPIEGPRGGANVRTLSRGRDRSGRSRTLLRTARIHGRMVE